MLKDKVIVITGGAGLLGRRFSSAISEAGGIAVVADRDVNSAVESVSAMTDLSGCRAEAVELDITDRNSIDALIGLLMKRHGRIDAVVNNAYPRNDNYGRKLEEVTYADFCDNVGMHLGGYFLVAQQFGNLFRKLGCGNIINIASIYGTLVPRFEIYDGTDMTMPVEYAAIKAAIIHLTRYFAQYFKTSGIRVNALSPGGIRNRQPKNFLERYEARCGARGMLSADDVAGALIFLLSDSSKYMTGQNLIVDDGFSL